MRLLSRRPAGFTLIELLVTIGVIAILIAVLLPGLAAARQHANCAGCAANMQILGLGLMAYTTDNDGNLPGRFAGTSDKWPVLLLPYVEDTKHYIDPGDPIATKIPASQLVSNTANNSSFFFNGFNDLGFYTNPNAVIKLSVIENPSSVILLGQKIHGSTQYYMDFVEGPNGNENDVLNKVAYFKGANYTFADGSARFLYLTQYSDSMWLSNKNYVIPTTF